METCHDRGDMNLNATRYVECLYRFITHGEVIITLVSASRRDIEIMISVVIFSGAAIVSLAAAITRVIIEFVQQSWNSEECAI